MDIIRLQSAITWALPDVTSVVIRLPVAHALTLPLSFSHGILTLHSNPLAYMGCVLKSYLHRSCESVSRFIDDRHIYGRLSSR